MTHRKERFTFLILFFVLLVIEVCIALFVRDRFLRPYGGDVLVTVLICCFLRIFIPCGVKLLPLYVFLFALAVEIGQYFDFVTLLGLGEIPFFRILLGSTFSAADIVCYGAGSALYALSESLILRGNTVEISR